MEQHGEHFASLFLIAILQKAENLFCFAIQLLQRKFETTARTKDPVELFDQRRDLLAKPRVGLIVERDFIEEVGDFTPYRYAVIFELFGKFALFLYRLGNKPDVALRDPKAFQVILTAPSEDCTVLNCRP